MKTTSDFIRKFNINKLLVLCLLTLAIGSNILPSCSQKNKSNQDGSFNDTLAVRKLLVQEIRKDLGNPAIDSIHERSNGINRWEIWYRIDKEFWSGESIELEFGDINGDGLNDAIAHIEYDPSTALVGYRPWKDWIELYVERTADGYKVKDTLPLFGYRYVGARSIKDTLIELTGYNWADGDPRCCPSIKDEFKIKLVGETFVKVVENIGNTPDPIAAEFEKAKLVADSLKKKFESRKHKLLKLSYEEESEGGMSWICYFDSLFKLNYLIEETIYGEGDNYTKCEFYNPEGIVLNYQIIKDPNTASLDTIIRLSQHIYKKKVIDYEKKVFNYSIEESEIGEPFAFKDQLVKYKLITTQENPQGNIAEKKLNEIPKEEFIYDSDSSCYKITIQKGEKGEFDSVWAELQIDSLLFVHLFGDK